MLIKIHFKNDKGEVLVIIKLKILEKRLAETLEDVCIKYIQRLNQT